MTALRAKRIAVPLLLHSTPSPATKGLPFESLVRGDNASHRASPITLIRSCIIYKQPDLTRQNGWMYRNLGCSLKRSEPVDIKLTLDSQRTENEYPLAALQRASSEMCFLKDYS